MVCSNLVVANPGEFERMHGLSKIGMVVILMIFALLSLMVAANGHSGVPYWGGLGFFLFCVLLCFYLVHLMTGEKGARR
jgi:hypothetical protein